VGTTVTVEEAVWGDNAELNGGVQRRSPKRKRRAGTEENWQHKEQ